VIQAGKKHALLLKSVPQDQIIDSVGAGDIFSAVFAYAFAKRHDVIKAAEFCKCCCARVVVLYNGRAWPDESAWTCVVFSEVID